MPVDPATMQFATGDVIWRVRRWHADPGTGVAIVKVGRKYVHLQDGGRLDIEALRRGDAGCANTICYPSKEHHANYLRVSAALSSLADIVRRIDRDRVTLEQIEAAMAALDLSDTKKGADDAS